MVHPLKPIPEIGKQYHFFDDGKVSYSRHSMAMVVAIISVEEAKHKTFINWEINVIEEIVHLLDSKTINFRLNGKELILRLLRDNVVPFV